MLNQVILEGYLSKNNELRYLNSGIAVCNNTIAVTKKWKNQSGEYQEKVCFIDIVTFRGAEALNQYTKRGSKVLVRGNLELEQWKDKNGNNRQKHKVLVEEFSFLDYKKPDKQHLQNENKPKQQSTKKNDNDKLPPDIDIDENEIPF